MFGIRLVRVHCLFAALYTSPGRSWNNQSQNFCPVSTRLDSREILCLWMIKIQCVSCRVFFFANIKPVNAVNQSLNPGRAPYKSMPSQLFQAQISGGRSWRLPIPSSMRFLLMLICHVLFPASHVHIGKLQPMAFFRGATRPGFVFRSFSIIPTTKRRWTSCLSLPVGPLVATWAEGWWFSLQKNRPFNLGKL